jgi:hypothetical protein
MTLPLLPKRPAPQTAAGAGPDDKSVALLVAVCCTADNGRSTKERE